MATPENSNDPQHVPHKVLSKYYKEESERREFLDDIFDRTAHSYDWTEKMIGFGTGPWYRHQALLRAGLQSGMSVVDVGIGTGLVAREAITIIGKPELLTGVDPSPGMVSQANLPDGVQMIQAFGEDMPLPDGQADFLSMGFALRHVSSLSAAFTEFYRVLKPGGKLCLLEITPPESAFYRGVVKTYMTHVVPTIAWVKTRDAKTRHIWQYYWETIEACVPPQTVMQVLKEAGFESVDRNVELGLFSEYQATKPKA